MSHETVEVVEVQAHAGPQAKAWVLVANHSRARFLMARVAEGPLEEIEDLVNPDARLHEGDLSADARGHLSGGQRGAGAQGHSAATDESAKRQRGEQFAGRIAHRLYQLRVEGAIARLHVVSEPGFLGMLRLKLDEPTKRLVSSETGCSMTRQPLVEIRSILPARL